MAKRKKKNGSPAVAVDNGDSYTVRVLNPTRGGGDPRVFVPVRTATSAQVANWRMHVLARRLAHGG